MRLTEPNGAHRVLFLCTGNSARSVMAECALTPATIPQRDELARPSPEPA